MSRKGINHAEALKYMMQRDWFTLMMVASGDADTSLLGFGHTLWKGMQKAISEDGFLGLFTGGFTACALGVSAALIFSYLSSMIFHPQMKD